MRPFGGAATPAQELARQYFASAHAVHGRLHVVADAPPGPAAHQVLLPMTRASSLQSNWKASPRAKLSGTQASPLHTAPWAASAVQPTRLEGLAHFFRQAGPLGKASTRANWLLSPSASTPMNARMVSTRSLVRMANL